MRFASLYLLAYMTIYECNFIYNFYVHLSKNSVDRMGWHGYKLACHLVDLTDLPSYPWVEG